MKELENGNIEISKEEMNKKLNQAYAEGAAGVIESVVNSLTNCMEAIKIQLIKAKEKLLSEKINK